MGTVAQDCRNSGVGNMKLMLVVLLAGVAWATPPGYYNHYKTNKPYSTYRRRGAEATILLRTSPTTEPQPTSPIATTTIMTMNTEVILIIILHPASLLAILSGL